jgi:group I intron endonuclease
VPAPDRRFLVYKITNKINGRAYIGVTTHKSVSCRWSQHKHCAANRPKGILHRAIAKYGPAAFSVETIAEAYSLKELDVLERSLIAAHGTLASAGGYNLAIGGRINVGMRPTPEQLAAMSERAKRQWGRPGYREKWLAKAAARHEETVARAAKQMADPERLRASIECFRKISLDPDERRRRSDVTRRRMHDPEGRKQHQEMMRRRWQDPAYRAEMAIAIQKSVATRKRKAQERRNGNVQ